MAIVLKGIAQATACKIRREMKAVHGLEQLALGAFRQCLLHSVGIAEDLQVPAEQADLDYAHACPLRLGQPCSHSRVMPCLVKLAQPFELD